MKSSLARIYALFFIVASFLPASASPQWRALNATEPNPIAIYTAVAEGDSVWAGSDGGVLRSGDGGVTWSSLSVGVGTGKVTLLNRWREHWMACQGSAFLLSKDGGRTWEARDTVLSGAYVRLVFRDDTVITWIRVKSTLWPDEMRFSTDGGQMWNVYTGDPGNAADEVGDTLATLHSTDFVIRRGAVWRKSGDRSDRVLKFRSSIYGLIPTTQGLIALSYDGGGFSHHRRVLGFSGTCHAWISGCPKPRYQ